MSGFFHPADGKIKKPTTSPMSPHLKRMISFTDDWIMITMYQRYLKLQGRETLLCRFLHIWYKLERKLMIDQKPSVFNSQFSKLQKNHKSLKLGIVVKRVPKCSASNSFGPILVYLTSTYWINQTTCIEL